ncbi:hypothetical protein BDR06DRAFT_839056, partial [Suillus hirtellus]
DGILAHRITDVCHIPGKLNVIADGLSRQWEGQPHDAGLQDRSMWTVSEDWEVEKGLVNDILLTSTIDEHTVRSLMECFTNESVFLEVIESLAQINSNKPLRDHKQAHHQASEYLIEDGKLWRLRGGTVVQAQSRTECVLQEEARQLAATQHEQMGHWGQDAIKIALTDQIYSPKLDTSIMNAI